MSPGWQALKPCGCWVSGEMNGWRIEAVAFFCREGHKQGDLVPYIHTEQAAADPGRTAGAGEQA